jgi:hypothetical protein
MITKPFKKKFIIKIKKQKKLLKKLKKLESKLFNSGIDLEIKIKT